MNKTIITIGRQYGSGGRQIGKQLAEQLGVPFYDRKLLTEAANRSGIAESLFEANDEQPTNSLLYSLAVGSFSMDMPLNHKLFLAQFDAIKSIAQKGPCVIVGRCADYALRDRDDCVNVFIYASLQDRIKRVVEEYGVPENKAGETILRTDKKRGSYYNYYTNKKWSHASSYNLSIDSGLVGIQGAVDLIAQCAKIVDNKKK